MTLPASSGYVEWCDRCGWNLEPPPRLGSGDGRFAHFVDALGRRSGEGLAREVHDRTDRRWSPARVLAYAIAVGVLLFDAALLVGGLGLIVVDFPNLVSMLVGATMVSVGVLLRPRFWERADAPALDPQRAPALHELVRKITEAGDVPAPHAIVVDATWNASWATVGPRRRRVLTLGLPLLTCLEPQERVAVIAHEVGHERIARARDVVLWPAVDALDHLSAVLRPPEGGLLGELEWIGRPVAAFVALPVDAVLWVQARLLFRDLQRAEYLADAHAARIAGPLAVIGLHERLLSHQSFALAVQRAATEGSEDDVITRIRDAVRDVPVRERERRRRVARLEHTRLTDTHPPTGMRIAVLEARVTAGAAVTLDGWNSDRIDAELEPHERELGRELIDRYRGSLYFG
jgi:Zn-dependent protease with chaperone function